jgi:hypothetical protein
MLFGDDTANSARPAPEGQDRNQRSRIYHDWDTAFMDAICPQALDKDKPAKAVIIRSVADQVGQVVQPKRRALNTACERLKLNTLPAEIHVEINDLSRGEGIKQDPLPVIVVTWFKTGESFSAINDATLTII